MKKASIDIGSNTILLLVAEVENQKIITQFEDESRVTSLGKNLDINEEFLEESMNSSFKALSEYKKIIEKYDIPISDVIVTATEASRVAKNASQFFKRIKKELGFSIQVISGAGEAFYTAFGVVKGSSINTDKVIVMDIGGASTELIKIQISPFKILESVSLPVGSVRATDWLYEGKFDVELERIFSKFDISPYFTNYLICVAGSMTSLGAMIKGLKEFDANNVHGLNVSMNNFLKFNKNLQSQSVDEIQKDYPFLEKRAPYIKGGALLGQLIGEKLTVEKFEVSTLGLRYGTILKGAIDEQYIQ